MSYLEGLNQSQREAVLYSQGPLLISAGAGTGKTRVITSKIAHTIEGLGVSPFNILAITFTNKAANEMKERVAKILDMDVSHLWIGTFHAICVRILRSNIAKIGYESSFSIYDRDDQLTLIRHCLKELNIDNKLYKESSILAAIGELKNKMIGPKDYQVTENNPYEEVVLKVYKKYEESLREYNSLDFDDLLIKTLECLEKSKETLDYYQEKFKYVFVDEYQDTNKVQYRLTQLLSGGHRNLTVVGDSDQSIYGWRGADINNIIDFKKDYKDAHIINLEENYRSSQEILDLANRVIKNNENRLDKRLWSQKEKRGKPVYRRLSSEKEEAIYVVDKIRELIQKGYKASDHAILYRTNAQSRSFEDVLMKRGLAYRVVGGLRFYDRMEVKDIIAYLRLISNSQDDVAFKRIVNRPRRAIGDKTVESLEEFAQENQLSLLDALEEIEFSKLSARAKKNLEEFRSLIRGLKLKSKEMGLGEFIEELIVESSYLKSLEAEATIEDLTRIENIREFISVAVDFQQNGDEDANLENFLQGVSLLSDTDKDKEDEELVNLMTIHSAKGLEFKNVFIVGMEEDIFPSYRSITSENCEEELEEERRLCYVAITRAMENLFITGARSRLLYGKNSFNLESRYLKEMGEGLERLDSPGMGFSSTRSFRDIRRQSFIKKQEEIEAGKKTGPSLKSGDRVFHKKFGPGMIVGIRDMASKDRELTINFEDGGIKRLLESISPLERKD